MFDEKFIENLPTDPIAALTIVANKLSSEARSTGGNQVDENKGTWIHAFALIKTLADTQGIAIEFPSLAGQSLTVLERVRSFCDRLQDTVYNRAIAQRSADLDRKFVGKFNLGFCYEFTEEDIDRSQTLINELRVEIAKSKFFEESHRQRLLRRLEKLQSELHKKMPDIDRIWGLVGDAGVAIGKFGADAKPIVDRIRELAQIGWKNQARAENLPDDCGNPFFSIEDNSEPDE